MRVERENPNQVYQDFWDWARADWHALWLISLVFAYAYYLMNTYEV